MKFKIACPHCSHSLSLADPKPGKYKPKCTACGTQFAIVVDPGDPPKIRVGQLSSNATSPTPEASQSGVTVKPQPQKPVESSATPTNSTPSNSLPLDATLVNAKSDLAQTVDSSLTVGDLSASAIARDSRLDQTVSPDLHATAGIADEAKNNPSSEPTGFDVTLSPSLIDVPKPTGFDVTMQGESRPPTPAQDMDQTLPEHEAGKVTAGTGCDFSVNQADQASRKPNTRPQGQVERLGGYRIVKELGAGGMGKVYLARQLSLDRPCAIKTIQADWAANPRVIARFIREAYAAAQLTHHNVVQIYDLGQDKGTNFFSMELVAGGSLDDQLRAKGKLPPKLAATLILQASRGLKFAHDHGMVHRDIKPANLMLTNDGLLKIADLGLVKTPQSDDAKSEDQDDVQSMMLASAKSQVTIVGASMGTPAYMSPEQAEDAASVDKRADIYSLGCTFYALLTGKPPFDGQTLLEVITKHRQEKITRPEVIVQGLPGVLGDIIEQMTAKSPEDRYQDLEDVINDLEVFLELREDMSKAKIRYFDARDHRSASSGADSNSSSQQTEQQSDSQAESSDTSGQPANAVPKVAAIHADIPVELAGKIQAAARSFQSSPLLWARKIAPMAWYGLCGLLTISALLMALISGGKLLASGAQSIASSASAAVGNLTGSSGEASTSGDSAATSGSALSSNFDNLLSRTKSALGYALALILGPVFAVILGGWEGKSPLALRYRESFVSGGIFTKIYWTLAAILALLVVHFLGLWLPAILGLLFGAMAGAGYYFGIEKPLGAKRRESVETSQGLLRQLRLRGLEEAQVQHAFAKHSGKDWEELFENIFGYDCMRAMRTKLDKSTNASRKVFRAYRDRLIDRWDARLSEAKRANEEELLARTEKAELIAAGVSASEAQKQANAMAASMVDAATETKQTMRELADGKLTDQAAEEKRRRIKTMLAEARSGKTNPKARSSRRLDALLGQLLGSKFRFACAAVLLLAVGMWVSSNRQSLENYWQRTKTTVSNISIEGGIAGAAETAKDTLSKSAELKWTPILGGLVTQSNVIYVALAGLLMAAGTLFYGWKKSLIFAPLTLLILAIPIFV